MGRDDGMSDEDKRIRREFYAREKAAREAKVAAALADSPDDRPGIDEAIAAVFPGQLHKFGCGTQGIAGRVYHTNPLGCDAVYHIMQFAHLVKHRSGFPADQARRFALRLPKHNEKKALAKRFRVPSLSDLILKITPTDTPRFFFETYVSGRGEWGIREVEPNPTPWRKKFIDFGSHFGRLEEWRPLYAEYLASAEWDQIRHRVLERDDYACQLKYPNRCGGRAIQVHHLSYDHVGDELMTELASTCIACHRLHHGSV